MATADRVVITIPVSERPIIIALRERHGVWLSGLFFAGLRRTEEYRRAKRQVESGVDLDAVCAMLRDGIPAKLSTGDDMWRVVAEMADRGLWRLELERVNAPGGWRWTRLAEGDWRTLHSLGPCLV